MYIYNIFINKSKLLTLRNKCPYSELFWSAISRIQIECGEKRIIYPYSLRMRENADQNNSDYGHLSDSVNNPHWDMY